MKTNSDIRLIALLAMLTPLLAAGCLDGDLVLELDKKGSGSIAAKYSIRESSVAQLKSMVSLGNTLDGMALGRSSTPPADPQLMMFLDPEEKTLHAELKKYEKFGIKIKKLKVSSRNARRLVELILEFDNIAEVARADIFADIGFSLYRRPTGDLVFIRKSMNAGNPNNNILSDETAQRLIAPILDGFMLTVKVRTPGKILEHNATSANPNSAVWVFDQDKDPEAFQKLQNQEFIMLLDGSGVTIPDIRIVKEKPSNRSEAKKQ